MKTLIIVDTQYDFMPGGALAVNEGDAIVPVINKVIPKFDLVVATQDWHPASHKSFASNHPGKNTFDKIDLHGTDQVLWPDHCVQGSKGAELHQELINEAITAIFRKGMNPEVDSYSAFYDNSKQSPTGLASYLREKGADDLYFCGLAADICVYFTLTDALKEEFNVTLIDDATRPLDKDTYEKQKHELSGEGVKILESDDLNF